MTMPLCLFSLKFTRTQSGKKCPDDEIDNKKLGMLSGIVFQIFYGLIGSYTAYLISVLYIEFRSRKEKEGVSFKNHVIQWFEVLDGLLGPYWKAVGLAFNCTFLLFGSVIQLITCARLFLRRKLSNLQWMAIVLLAIGTTTSQVKGCGETSCESLLSSPIQGYMLAVLSACLSALAGVYTEFLMKKNNDSLYWQNIQLYTFGAIFNMLKLVMDDFRSGFENGPWWQRIFNGYSMTTWMVVLNLGSTGLLVSWLMKYADNIVKETS